MQRVRIKFNDEGEQKLIPGVSKPKKPPTQAQIEMAKIMAECYSVKKAKKGILVVKSASRDTEAPPASTPPQSPLARQNHHSAVETDEEQEENKHPPTPQQQEHHYYPPSSPEAPSFYRGKPPELLSRRYPV